MKWIRKDFSRLLTVLKCFSKVKGWAFWSHSFDFSREAEKDLDYQFRLIFLWKVEKRKSGYLDNFSFPGFYLIFHLLMRNFWCFIIFFLFLVLSKDSIKIFFQGKNTFFLICKKLERFSFQWFFFFNEKIKFDFFLSKFWSIYDSKIFFEKKKNQGE